MAIVCARTDTVEEYRSAGRNVEVDRPNCPTCGHTLVMICPSCRGKKGGARTSPAKKRAARKAWLASAAARRAKA